MLFWNMYCRSKETSRPDGGDGNNSKSKRVDVASLSSCALELPKKLPLTANRARLEAYAAAQGGERGGIFVSLHIDPLYVPRDEGSPSGTAAAGGEGAAGGALAGVKEKGGAIDLRFPSTDMACRFVDATNALMARAVVNRKR